jgi:hypothetical protein
LQYVMIFFNTLAKKRGRTILSFFMAVRSRACGNCRKKGVKERMANITCRSERKGKSGPKSVKVTTHKRSKPKPINHKCGR